MQIWTLKICIHDISNTITARGFKLGQLIEDDEEIMSPQPKGGGDILFLVRIPSAWASESASALLLSVRYLLNRWMDFDQTYTDTLLGGRNELIRFW